jgi:hypothetical protein
VYAINVGKEYLHTAPIFCYTMIMDTITRSGSAKTIAFNKRVHPAIRIGITLIGLFPLLVPYELLIKARWETTLSAAFLLSLFVSLLMMVASAFVLFVAFFAQNQYVCFDGHRATLTYGWSDAIRPYRETVYRFTELSPPELLTTTWSDSPNSYDILIRTNTGSKISFGNFEKEYEAQACLEELLALLP